MVIWEYVCFLLNLFMVKKYENFKFMMKHNVVNKHEIEIAAN